MRTTDFSRAPAAAHGGAMFVGATRYRGPLTLLRLLPRWLRMVRDLKRVRGYCWHHVYWQPPFTLGTIAVFSDRDAMLRFARTREHRALMTWVTSRRNATAGFIRLYSAEEAGYSNGRWRAEGDEMAAIDHFTPLSREAAGPAAKVVR